MQIFPFMFLQVRQFLWGLQIRLLEPGWEVGKRSRYSVEWIFLYRAYRVPQRCVW